MNVRSGASFQPCALLFAASYASNRLPAPCKDGSTPSVVWGRETNAGTKLADHVGVPQKVLYLHPGATVERVAKEMRGALPTSKERRIASKLTKPRLPVPSHGRVLPHASKPNALRVVASPIPSTDQGFESTLVLLPVDDEAGGAVDMEAVLDEWEVKINAQIRNSASVQSSRDSALLVNQECQADFKAFRADALRQLPSYFKKLTGGYRYDVFWFEVHRRLAPPHSRAAHCSPVALYSSTH